MNRKTEEKKFRTFTEKFKGVQLPFDLLKELINNRSEKELQKILYLTTVYALTGELDETKVTKNIKADVMYMKREMDRMLKKFIVSEPNGTKPQSAPTKEKVEVQKEETKPQITPTIEEEKTPTVEESKTPKKEVLSFDALISKIEREYEQKQKEKTVINQTKTKYEEWDEFESSFFTSTPRSLKEVAYN